MSDEERRAKDRERKRESRAKAAAEREAERAARRQLMDASAPSVMRDALEEALASMKWLMPSDHASVAQARLLAKQVDLLTVQDETVKAIAAHRALSAVLDRLGGTPTMRMQHELRSLRLAAKTEGGAGGDDGEKPPANVSKFERPAKRRQG